MPVIIDLLSTNISDTERKLLKHPNTAGVILFTRNYQNKTQLTQLTHAIHEINPDLILFADHEGGNVQRFQRHGFTSLPAAHVYGVTYDIEPETGLKLAETYGEIMARELRECGIHVGLAPVLDINGSNPIIGKLDRAFHTNPEILTQLASAFIRGMHKAGMPSVGKHFPGHGFCESDSHIASPTDFRPLEALEACDLVPFTELTKSEQLDAIMPAHVTYPEVDPNNAAGYSSTWLLDILRNKVQFKKIIISDCLGMTGADIGSLLERGIQALDAGCNLLIAANQERAHLEDFLNALPEKYLAENQHYIAEFKRKISPLAVNPPVQQAAAEELSTPNNTQNPTLTI
ncbi:MAG: beta-N-acetylhexosaminidase [Gammaproteobacteria bacterium]|nr:beta-N-acetylhexosaminidase [Gammaproteobacteria bacterium]MCH9762778.1 beta-N-acetylhexosaminidase [Gammaproteobacteria bacterium]